MNTPINEAYCCCSIFPIRNGVYLIPLHTFLQATYGLLLIITSYYRKQEPKLILFIVGSAASAYLAGILVFGTSLYRNYTAIRVGAGVFTLVTLLNFCGSIAYILWFNDFSANSQLDKLFFWRNPNDWVGDRDLLFCIWHVLAYCYMFTSAIWWYYSYQLWKYASLLKLTRELEAKEVKEPVVVPGKP